MYHPQVETVRGASLAGRWSSEGAGPWCGSETYQLRHGAGTIPAGYRHQAAQRPSYGGGFLSILTTGQDLQKTTPRFNASGAGLGFRVVVRIRAHRQRRIVSLDFKGVELIGGAAGAVSNDSA